MANWSSILPSSLSSVESWLVQLFLLLGLLTIGPWLALLTYDITLFLFRAVYHEFLSVFRLQGGRAGAGASAGAGAVPLQARSRLRRTSGSPRSGSSGSGKEPASDTDSSSSSSDLAAALGSEIEEDEDEARIVDWRGGVGTRGGSEGLGDERGSGVGEDGEDMDDDERGLGSDGRRDAKGGRYEGSRKERKNKPRRRR